MAATAGGDMPVRMREVLVRPWVGVRVSFVLKASSVCLIIRIHFITICVIFSDSSSLIQAQRDHFTF